MKKKLFAASSVFLVVALLCAGSLYSAGDVSWEGIRKLPAMVITTLTTSIIKPPADSTTAVKVTNTAGTALMTFDTTNSRVGIGTTPSSPFHVLGSSSAAMARFGNSNGTFSAGFDSSNGYFQPVTADKGMYLYNAAGQYIGVNSVGNIALNAGSFGTSAVKVVAIGEGTAPTTSPANMVQLWSADQDSIATRNALYMRNESGQSGVVAHQAPLQNLLSNSGFKVWANSTLENVLGTSNLVTSWTNSVAGGYEYETFTTSGADITSAVNSSGAGTALSNASILTSGKLYRVTTSLTLNSGTAPSLYTATSAGAGITLLTGAALSGAQTIVFEAEPTANKMMLYNAGAGDWSLTFTLYEVTPGCVAADTLGPDEWAKSSTLDVYREYDPTYTNVYGGSLNGVRLVSSAASDSLYQTFSAPMVAAIAGKRVTLGVWAKTSTASNFRLAMSDGSTTTYSSSHSGGGTWEWLEVTKDNTAAPTTFIIYLQNVNSSATSYVSSPMLVRGPSIGQGNYSEPRREIVWTNLGMPLSSLDNKTGASGFSDVAATTLNLESETSGKVPKGAKAVYLRTIVRDSGSAATATALDFICSSTGTYVYRAYAHGVANDSYVSHQGWASLNTNGDLLYTIDASGSNTFDVSDCEIFGVQVN